ncbi:PHP-associated domain-containing protein [Halorussus sp. MSC15.2]|uniref:PHP-associated domain-containing protein n=1 Tax=Halorussus sp. MSC15.2 TaxID=2283638 RepID=UPI0013D31DE3|nr:PHP-associated domain-containing protein [Halorussus sp. MSC15.2]NEU57472.1 PHP domain-containing protein [Halorussus sp. MSC15.2]
MTGGESFRVDLHVKVLDESVVERAKERGLDAIVYAPHFTRLPDVRQQAARFSDDDLLVVPGREVFTGDWRNRRHLLAVGLDAPVPDFISFDAAMDEFDRQDAAVLAPHPEFLNVSLSESDFSTYRDRIDAIETYNSKHWPHHNERARELAAEYDLPAFTSSYAHLRGSVGEAWTEFRRSLDSADELVAALKEGVPRRIVRRSGWRHELRCAAEFAHLGWENSYEKLDRLFLSGMEPTHPDHIAYGDRFDGVY